jgi:ribonuclease Z
LARQVELITLGTGAALPSLERQTAGYLVRDWMGNVVLLDAGEGVQQRLRQADVSPTKVEFIAITHGHGDHINGLPGLLGTMQLSGRKSKLTIVAPKYIADPIREMVEANKFEQQFPVEVIDVSGDEGSIVLSTQGRDSLALSWFRVCHSIEAYGYSLTWTLGPRLESPVEPLEARRLLQEGGEGLKVIRPFKLSYTGDTSPCDSVVRGASGANVLIHECTFEASMQAEASQYGHSTSVGAAQDALRSGAGKLILSHVSTRYEGYEALQLEQEARSVFPNSILAWDLARFVMNV